MYNFDVVFIDCGSAIPYDRKSLETRPLGGTESSVIRVAEGLGALRFPGGGQLQIAVVKASDPDRQIYAPDFEPIYGQNVYYLPEKYLTRMTTKFSVMIRGPKYATMFPEAKKFIWLHDLADDRIKAWQPVLEQNNTTIIGVSRWHKRNIEQHCDCSMVTYIYNPLPDDIYRSQPRVDINRSLMVWASSPHKGLNEALAVYKKVHERLPNMQLLIYNPGYIKGDIIINPGVLYYGPTTANNVHHNIKKSLCVFYPTIFEETFGLVAAEANALGVPVVGYKVGALDEITTEGNSLCNPNDETAVVNSVVSWYTNGPPHIQGNDSFRIGNVVQSWLNAFAGKLK